MPYTLADLHRLARLGGRNAMDSRWYSYQSVDYALLQSLKDWARRTKVTGTLTQITLTVGSNVVPTLPADLKAEYITQAYLSIAGSPINPGIQFSSYEDVLCSDVRTPGNWGDHNSNALAIPNGQPTMLGFQTPTTAFLNTLCDQAYTLNLWWWDKPPAWQAGQAFVAAMVIAGAITSLQVLIPGSIYRTPPTITISDAAGTGATIGAVAISLGSIVSIQLTSGGSGYVAPAVSINGVSAAMPVFNMDDDALEAIASLGAPYYLQKSEPANRAQAQSSYQQFEETALQFAGRGAGQPIGRVLQMRNPYG
jgi:hypothetical protein